MFSLTLMSKGEKRIWVPLLPSMPKGEIVGKCLTGNICLSLMASTTMKMARVQEECNRQAPEVFWEDTAEQPQ
jgi:hypothetical protein